MTKKTIDDVYDAVVSTNTKVEVLIAEFKNFQQWKVGHDEKDEREHGLLHQRISNVKFGNMLVSIFAAAVAIWTGTKVK